MWTDWLNTFSSGVSVADTSSVVNETADVAQSLQVPEVLQNFQAMFADALSAGFTGELSGTVSEGINASFSFDNLSSAEGLSQLQASFLSALQSDLFASAQNNIAESIALSATTSSDSAAEVSGILSDSAGGILNQAYQFMMGNDGATLDDLFDTVNVLNHIPIVSDVYESVTDNHVDFAASLAGGFLYAGPIGLAYEGVDYFVSSSTGASMTQHMKNYVMDSWFSDADADTAQLAESITDSVSENAHSFVTRNLN